MCPSSSTAAGARLTARPSNDVHAPPPPRSRYIRTPNTRRTHVPGARRMHVSMEDQARPSKRRFLSRLSIAPERTHPPPPTPPCLSIAQQNHRRQVSLLPRCMTSRQIPTTSAIAEPPQVRRGLRGGGDAVAAQRALPPPIQHPPPLHGAARARPCVFMRHGGVSAEI